MLILVLATEIRVLETLENKYSKNHISDQKGKTNYFK